MVFGMKIILGSVFFITVGICLTFLDAAGIVTFKEVGHMMVEKVEKTIDISPALSIVGGR